MPGIVGLSRLPFHTIGNGLSMGLQIGAVVMVSLAYYSGSTQTIGSNANRPRRIDFNLGRIASEFYDKKQ